MKYSQHLSHSLPIKQPAYIEKSSKTLGELQVKLFLQISDIYMRIIANSFVEADILAVEITRATTSGPFPANKNM